MNKNGTHFTTYNIYRVNFIIIIIIITITIIIVVVIIVFILPFLLSQPF
jgi:hypothetical protein